MSAKIILPKKASVRGENDGEYICYLDFDGVLHDDSVFWSESEGMHIQSIGRCLFEWAHILEQLLVPYPEVKIVISSSWVRLKGFDFAKRRLPATLQSRVVGATFDNKVIQKFDFDSMSRGEQILRDVMRRAPVGWFAIDNDDRGWPATCKSHLIKTEDHLGLSEAEVQRKISRCLSNFFIENSATVLALHNEVVRLYLDIDGVLHAISPTDYTHRELEFLPAFEQILRQFPMTEVVISSSWRKEFSLDELRHFFSEDLRARIVGTTPVLPGKTRFDEIKMHVKESNYAGEFLVLDDDSSQFPKGWNRLLLCSSGQGLNLDRQTELHFRLEKKEHY